MGTPPRPFVLLHYALSADGKIATADRGWAALGSRRDRDHVDALRAAADAVLIGAGTVRAEDPPIRIASAERRAARRAAGQPEHPLRIVLSASLDLPEGGRFLAASAARPLVLTTEDAPAARRAALAPGAEILAAGRGRVDLTLALAQLSGRGVGRLVVEGGGEVNAAFLEAGLVDEVHLTLCPLLLGGRLAPTPAGGTGFAGPDAPRLRLLSSETIGDEIVCRYAVRRDGPASPP